MFLKVLFQAVDETSDEIQLIMYYFQLFSFANLESDYLHNCFL